MYLVDSVFALYPQAIPSTEALEQCRLVSHRGEHDNQLVHENTLLAFRAARDAGVWGLECDIRWTRDQVPVVIHDEDGQRVFSESAQIADITMLELRRLMPLVPTLAEVVVEFGGQMHLMLEIKEEREPWTMAQQSTLASVLRSLEAGRDYHFLALDPVLFSLAEFAPQSCLLPVAEFQIAAYARCSIQCDWSGVSGHYLLLTNAICERQHRAGKSVGSGFSNSRNVLFREINRGVDWVFSNEAVAMQKLIDKLQK